MLLLPYGVIIGGTQDAKIAKGVFVAESKETEKALNPAITGDICGKYCFVKEPFRVIMQATPSRGGS